MTRTGMTRSGDPFETVEIGDLTFIREHGDEWMLWCGCGDCIALPDVIHEHCINCHILCEDTTNRPVNAGEQ